MRSVVAAGNGTASVLDICHKVPSPAQSARLGPTPPYPHRQESGDLHSIHLRWSSLELTNIARIPTTPETKK
jgi:hypothetical protein